MRTQIHDDDEPPTQTDENISFDGNVEARTVHKQEAPMGENQFKVLLELKGIGSKEGRLGVDLVTVLDISGSMRGKRLLKLKLAMKFLVQKLGVTDRLAVVTFNRRADKLCPLRRMDAASQREILDEVDGLTARSATNTEAGLKMAFEILKDRTYSQSRRVAIMLMSDGMEDFESQADSVPLSNVPVYTFALGDGSDHHKVLRDIANKSNGGMFASVSDSDSLNVAFSTALAGLLNVVIDDLTLTIAPLNSSQLNEVNAGSYPQTKQDTTRRVLVVLTLPKVEVDHLAVNIFNITYEYRVDGEDIIKSDEKIINVKREKMSTEAENEEVLAEERRVKTVSKMKEARLLADRRELEEARKKLADAKKLLSEADTILMAQLDQLFLFMVSPLTYDEEGSAFASALEASHEAQRATAVPGADVFQVGMFRTPLMDLYIEQARLFDEDPEDYIIPTEEEDRQLVALVQ
ncbi:hypothetical protein MKW92_049283 [Papaver armeniacum]|nr:hypothetical protein MKW92_049283 [Papaver armeniacum]